LRKSDPGATFSSNIPIERAPTDMKKLSAPLLVLAALAFIVAGCGGSSGSSASGGNQPTNGGGGVNGISVGNCLNENYDFLVQPSQKEVDGQSPAGVSFSLTFYKDAAAATAAGAKKNAKTTAIVENGVVDFHGNPSIYAGAPPAKISKTEIGNIRTCINQSKTAK
jgi:hypothetical protein